MKERASERVVKSRDQDDRLFKLRLFVPDPKERSITWQRTTEMYGTIERLPGVTWEQVEKALATGCYYLDDEDGTICVHEEGLGLLAVINPSCSDEDDDVYFTEYQDDGFVLGDE